MKKPSAPPLQSVTRRNFLKTTALATSAIAFFDIKAMAGPFTEDDFRKLVPLDKKLTPQWLQSLTERGEASVWRGAQLQYVGMPCNGIGTGQVYLSGDGRLWHWGQLGIAEGHWKTAGPRYQSPDKPEARLPIQGAALRIGSGESARTLALDSNNCPDTSFTPRWPVGTSRLRDPKGELTVEVSGWTPFIPGNAASSSWPVSVLDYTLTNTSSQTIEVELAVWLKNAIGYSEERRGGFTRTVEALPLDNELSALRLGVKPGGATPTAGNDPDARLFAGFEEDDYGDWTASGTAFGARPMRVSEIPGVQKVSNLQGQGLANSFTGSDKPTGILRSPEFTVEKDYINFRVGGGVSRSTRVQLTMNNLPMYTASGKNSGDMELVSWDVRSFKGQSAKIEIIDGASGSWGHIVVDHIEFSDRPAVTDPAPFEQLTDLGEMVLAMPGAGEHTQTRALVGSTSLNSIFESTDSGVEAAAPQQPVAVVARRVVLEAGASVEIPVVLAWHFKKTPMDELNYYATLWPGALPVLQSFVSEYDALRAATFKWVATWYERSSLPWWLMERAIIPADCMQTNTVYRLADRGGRYHLYEGVTCCEGNCTHVWHYAQALAYLFPEIERDGREMLDLEMSQSLDGQMAMRWTNKLFKDAPVDAVDGTSGTILRILREHRMSSDGQFLSRVWPDAKRALEWQIKAYDSDADGILTGGQHNTLDAAWWGKIPWITSLHLAALEAAATLADEVGDRTFAKRYRELRAKGTAHFNEVFFNAEKGYYVMQTSPERPQSPGTYQGCHIDQVMGQGWASLMHLPRVLPEAETKRALQSIWDNNFTPNVGPYRERHPGGRWYSMPGEAGTFVATFPKGGAEKALGKGVANHSAYMNETMTGFEWQVSGHMVGEGMLTEGLAVGKAIADRYQPHLRNSFNELECGDHYARAMASYGTFLAVCGFVYHGPKGQLAYSPRIRPEAFKAPFTAAEGWGTLEQTRQGNEQINRIQVQLGQLVLNQLNLELPAANAQLSQASLGSQPLKARIQTDGTSCKVHFEQPVTIHTDETLELSFTI